MLKLLIADSSEPFTDALSEIFRNEFDLKICQDGETALELLVEFQPDVLILNLMLPFKDGLTVLQESAHKPKVILAITPYVNAYIEQVATGLEVQYIMIMPTVNSLRIRLMDMIATTITSKEGPVGQAVVHLHILNFLTHLDGYQQLCLGLPIFVQNPQQLLTKELYPAIAQQCNRKDGRSVEHSIRKAIQAAWSQRDNATWRKYFSLNSLGHIPCPTNKEFICRLAQVLTTE